MPIISGGVIVLLTPVQDGAPQKKPLIVGTSFNWPKAWPNMLFGRTIAWYFSVVFLITTADHTLVVSGITDPTEGAVVEAPD